MSKCFNQFLTNFLTDILICPDQIEKIKVRADRALGVYDTVSSSVSLTEIATNTYTCVSEVAENTTNEISRQYLITNLIYCISTVVIVMLIILCLVYLSGNKMLILIAILIFVYIIVLLAISYVSYGNLQSITKDSVKNINVCFDQTVKEINNYEEVQQAAINAALCAYGA